MLQKIAHSVFTLYWKIFRPKTYGVKVLIVHPQDPEKVLLVLHRYGDQKLWNIPGGGYNPRKETSENAASREVQEELRVVLQSPHIIGQYYTEAQGKQDTVDLFVGTVASIHDFNINKEIATFAWVDYRSILERKDVAHIVHAAIRHHFDVTRKAWKPIH